MICGGVYLVENAIKHGSFGAIYKGKNIITHEPVAIKTDYNCEGWSLINHEASILQYLSSSSVSSITRVYNYGKLSDGSYYLVMPYYLMSLDDYIRNNNHTGRALDIEQAKTMLHIIINILKNVHDKYVIHRDVKPANFMIHNESLVLIDFGLATYYVDDNKTHVTNARPTEEGWSLKNARHSESEGWSLTNARPTEEGWSLSKTTGPSRPDLSNTPIHDVVGSRRYASINVLNRNTPSRRDDIISAAYIYVSILWPELFFINGSVDWIQIKQLSNMPDQVKPLFEYLYSLAYMERPDYEKVIQYV